MADYWRGPDAGAVVPHLVGRSLPRADLLARQAGLRIRVLNDVEAYPAGTVVVGQEPTAGGRLGWGEPVSVEVAPGGGAGVREPRRPRRPDGNLHAAS